MESEESYDNTEEEGFEEEPMVDFEEQGDEENSDFSDMGMSDEDEEFEMEDDLDFGGEDSKKTIERLTGKLSQLLRMHQENNDEPDPSLAKYVAGMIISASIKDLDEKGIEDIYDKFKERAEEIKEEDDYVYDDDDEE